MSPQFHAKKEITSITTKPNNNNINEILSPHLKVNKDSHFIKKSTSSSSPPSSSSSSSSIPSSHITASNKPPQQHRHPVIIYTHSPRVIKTNRRDFMALVQKLTGLSHNEEEEEDNSGDNRCNTPLYENPKLPKQEEHGRDVTMMAGDKERNNKQHIRVENYDTLSVIKEEEYCNDLSENQVSENEVSWCFNAADPQSQLMYERPPLNPLKPYIPDLSDLMRSNQPLLNYSDSWFFTSSIQSSSNLDEMEEFRNF